jgi:hypothetical protein
LARQNERIVFSKAEIECAQGEKPKHISLNEIEGSGGFGGKNLGGKANAQDKMYRQVNSIDTLYSLFLNHLLRPREWTA